MIKIGSLDLSNFRQIYTHILISIFTVFLLTTIIQAQPEFSKDELRLLKERKIFSDAFKYRLPQEKFPMPETSIQSRSMIADGDLDSTFNASVTEGFGYVNETVVQPDGKIIAVGLFQRANGTRTNGIARFNADGTLDTTFNSGTGANAAIRAVVLQSDGKIIIGGAFTSFNGQTVNRIARLNSNGSIDSSFSSSTSFNAQINDILILPDGKILVGGAFSVANASLIRLNGNGTFDSAIGFAYPVYTISLAPGNKILVGGEFEFPYSSVARLNADGTIDSTFSPSSGGNAPVYKTLVQPDGKILVAGVFTSFNGVSTDGLVRLNDNGSVDTTFEITDNPQLLYFGVYDLALQPDGKILANFFEDSTIAFADVWRFNPDASRDLTFNTNTDNSLTAVDMNLLSDGRVLLSGYFISVNNQQHLRLLKLNPDGGLDNSFNPALSSIGIIYAIKRQPDGKLIIGGDFEYVNGVRKSGIARLNQDGSVDNTFTIQTGFIGDIYAIEVQSNGKIIIGGFLQGDSSFPPSSVARLNSDGSLDRAFNNGANFVLVPYSVAVQTDGKILAGGVIYDGLGRLIALIKFLANGDLDSSFLPLRIPSGSVRSVLAQSNGKIIFGGTFLPATSGSLQRNGIARLNNDGSLDSAFSTPVGSVYSLKQQSNGQIYAGGLSLTRFSADGIVDPTLNVGSGFTGLIRAVEVQQDGKIVLGGAFTSYNGNSVNRLIRISSVGALDTTFAPNPGGIIYASNVQADGKIVAAGQFLDFNNTEKFNIVRLQNSSLAPRRAPFDFDGDGKTDVSIFRPNGGEWWYQRSSDGQVPAVQFGSGTDKIVPGDYTGDGKTDVAFFRPSTGQWFILRSEDYSFYAFPFGASGDIPAPADYDGDGKIDPTVFRPSNGVWYTSKSTGGVSIEQFGLNGDIPVAADYDGDGKADIGVFRPSTGGWWINRSNSSLLAVTFGDGADKPVSGDYTGDGKADVAFFRPSTGQWFVLRSENFSFYGAPFGAAGDVPVPGDYDGDGKFDFAVFRSSNSGWYISRSTAGVISQQFGFSTDQPVPSAFIP